MSIKLFSFKICFVLFVIVVNPSHVFLKIIITVPVWPRGRDLRRLGREAETLEDLAERPRGRDLRILARGAETLEDLPEGPRP